MAKKYYQTQDFLELRRKYYQKLKDKGFRDIENIDWSTGDSGNLLNGFGHMDAVRRWSHESQRYYELARQKAKDLRSRIYSKDDRKVWRLHAEGHSFRAIERDTGIPRARVSRIVKRIAKEILPHVRNEED
jgi:hypothetical protein